MSCPKCGSTNTNKKGWLFLVDSKKQRYKCRDCGYKYTEKDYSFNGSDLGGAPAVLVMDIETLPSIGYFWNPWGADIRPEFIIKDWCVLAWAAKWLSDGRLISDVLLPKEATSRNDLRIVKGLWKLMDDADVIIAQNGKKFDIPKMNTRFWRYQMPHPANFKVIDTLDAARRTFGMTYNNLDYLAEYLGAGKKLKVEFPLWVDCDHGNPEALKYMSEYNQGDVTLLENVYLKMRGWIPNHPRFTTYEKIIGVCPVCMDRNIKHIGLYTATVRQYKEFRCDKCGAVWHNTKAEK